MKRFFFIFILCVALSSAYGANVIITSFNSGILGPTLSGRIDFQKYTSGMQTCLNAVPLPQGGVTRRPGTEYLGSTASNNKARLIPFVFSEEQSYVLEFTDVLMRVWADGGIVQTVDANTKLLLHFDDYNSSQTFTDSGTTGHTITVAADAQHDTSQKKFGASSAYFDGANDYIHMPDHADFALGSDDYTIDLWVRVAASSGNLGIFENYVDADNHVRLYLNGADDIAFNIRSGGVTKFGVIVSGNYISQNTWHHIAIVRDGDDIGYAVDGTWIYSTTDTDMDWPDFAATFVIGSNTGLNDYHGWIDEFRLSNAARWTIGTNFVVPTFPYPTGDGTGINYTTATPYSEGHLDTLRYVQSADTMYIVHPDFMPRKLTRTAHDSWTFTAFNWDSADFANETGWPPFQNINDTGITLDPSAVTGAGITITASQSFFVSAHIGAYFRQKSGFYKITAVASGTSATADVIDDLTDHTATADWYESSWSPYRGFPSVVAFFEERLSLANNKNQPNTIWMSESDDYEDFVTGASVEDTDSLTVMLLAEKVNAIKWLLSDRRLLIGTTGGEWWLTGDTTENAVTPTSILVRKASDYGSGDTQPVKPGTGTLFVQRPGKKVRNYQYHFDTDSYQATDLSILAETITDGLTIDEIVYQSQPYQLVWCRMSDGTLATLSYMPEHDVYAWATHELGGAATVESLAVIPGDADDELYMAVSRTINSASVRYIERLKPFYFASINNAVYSDAAATYSGAAATTITGLNHLEAESVAVLADGAVVTGKTVSSGQITLSTAASAVHVGLAYSTDIETMRLGVGSPLQTVQGLLKRINKVTARLYKTLSASIGPDSSNLTTLIDTYSTEIDQEIRITQGRSPDGVVFIRVTQPGPLTLLALILDVEVY